MTTTDVEERHAPSWMTGVMSGPGVVSTSGTSLTGTMTMTAIPKPYAPGRVIAMHGDPGAGKDTVGQYLVEQYGFTRLAFADKLKVMCEALDPIVAIPTDTDPRWFRLAEIVAKLGWDLAKKRYPEVRRTQQRLATEVIRAHVDPQFWVKAVEAQMLPGGDYVITDLRFPNEYEMVRRHGGAIWWIKRTDNPYGGLGENATHVSESWHPPRYHLLVNDFDITELHAKVDAAMTGGGFAHHEITA